jgi:hypothetical protein
MKHLPRIISLILFSLTITIMKTNAQNDALRSRAEISNYEETSHYADVISFIGELQKRTSNLRVISFGKSTEGRDLPLMIFADPPISQPREARLSGKPVIFVMANIHAGEVEGKEAMLHLARRIGTGNLRALLKNLIILIAPIYNADGNERIALEHRTAQNGPVGGVGIRENAKGLDLNRDYLKLESVEANALIQLFNNWDPHLTVDLHTTNGSYHGYHLTYAPMLNPNADERLIAFLRKRMLPAITRAAKTKHGYRLYHYGNFATAENLNRELDRFRDDVFESESRKKTATASAKGETKVWRTFDHRPRFGNSYVGLRNRLTILSEAYSYLDFKSRIEVTAAFVEEILSYSALHAAEIVALINRVDADTIKLAGSGKTAEAGVQFKLTALPQKVPIFIGAVEKIKNPRSGREMTAMIENQYQAVLMPDYGLFEATKSVPIPAAWILPNELGLQIVIEKLRVHGITIEELTQPLTIEAQTFVIDKVNRAARAFQGHTAVSLAGHPQKETITYPAGTMLVRSAQPLARVAFYLLEAESDDGLAYWNFLDAYLEKGKTYPIHKIMGELKAATTIR